MKKETYDGMIKQLEYILLLVEQRQPASMIEDQLREMIRVFQAKRREIYGEVK
jgi:hypothetical protein